MVSLPLKRLHQPRNDIHPQVVSAAGLSDAFEKLIILPKLLQQHINRGTRRLARMTGRQEPSKDEQRAKLHKRMYLLEHGPGSRNGKRYNRNGVTNSDALVKSAKSNSLAATKGGVAGPAANATAAA